MADDIFDKAAKAQPAKKGDIFDQATPPTDIPDAAAQAHAATSAAIKPVIPGTAIVDPTGGKMATAQAGKDPKYTEYMKQSGRMANETAGGMAGGALASPLLKGAEAAGGGGTMGWILKALARNAGIGAGTGAGAMAGGARPAEALETAAGTTLAGTALEGTGAATAKIAKSVKGPAIDPLAKINKLLGVGSKELRVGKMPESLDEFSANPARGVVKAGMDEKSLAKMNPLERNAAITKARDAAGKKLDEVLKQASSEGKTVNLYKTLDDTFKKIPDPKVAKQAETRLLQILKQHGINKPLNQLTPTEARAVQRSLDDFANFASVDTAKTFRDVATQLRRGISAETRKVVPASQEFDQDYGDLANAVKATQKSASKFARSAPESTLRKIIKRAAIAGGTAAAGGLGYEVGKHFSEAVP